MDALRCIASANWPTTVGRLKTWNLGVTQDGDDDYQHFVVRNLEYTYQVRGKEYSSKNVGYGFPHRADVRWVRASVARILRSAPDVSVYYNPVRPSQSGLSVGFRMYHLANLACWTFVFAGGCLCIALRDGA